MKHRARSSEDRSPGSEPGGRAFESRRARHHCLHFVGFRDDRYWAAVKIFGVPDFIHRIYDVRAAREAMPGDTVIFATGSASDKPRHPSFDDSRMM